MKLNKQMKILIVGLGLLGGSYAMALTKRGYDVSAITLEQSSIDFAMEKGIIRRGSASLDREIIGSSDVVVFALYPKVFTRWIEENQALLKSGAILTDVTGVKAPIIEPLQKILRPDLEFISAHPMAGKEVYGVENSDDAIFKNANYIVVPTEKNTLGAIELCEDLGHELGFKTVSVLTPEKHDEMIAFLSQLTHCIAVSLMCSKSTDGFIKYTGDSFRDLTRIAKINENMWSELFDLNRDELLKSMDSFLSSFIRLRQTLVDNDFEQMKEMMRLSTDRRQLFDKK